MNDRMARLYEQALQDTPSDTAAPPERGGAQASGSDAFTQNCAACHGVEGRGVAGAFPPLAMSDWVTGEARTPVRIVLYGLQGSMQVSGAAFNGTMPAFGARLTDQELAAVLSYVRSSWGNDAPAISPGDVKTVREAETGRTRPFTPGDVR
jgi:mono/diheme cytochrome c family protein